MALFLGFFGALTLLTVIAVVFLTISALIAGSALLVFYVLLFLIVLCQLKIQTFENFLVLFTLYLIATGAVAYYIGLQYLDFNDSLSWVLAVLSCIWLSVYSYMNFPLFSFYLSLPEE